MLKKQSKQSFDKNFTQNLKIAIVRTNYHVELIENLENYAKETLINAGVKQANVHSFIVPGSWELPIMAQTVAKTKKFDAIIAFGVIVKGETYHFEMIANEVARALMNLSLDYSTPIALEVLAVFAKKQADARAGNNDKNKGIEAANAVLQTLAEMTKVNLKK